MTDPLGQRLCQHCGRIHIPNMTVVKTWPDLVLISSCRVQYSDRADVSGGIAIIPLDMAEQTIRGEGYFGHGRTPQTGPLHP